MHWIATDEGYHEALRRLAVVLLVLAGLAERIGSRSWPFRSLVLWLLRRAETRARDFAIRSGALPVLSAEDPVRIPGGHGEATRLAQGFRALAAIFFALSGRTPQWLRIARRQRPRRSCRDAKRPARRFVDGLRPYADTS
jgi:hypothetical protein